MTSHEERTADREAGDRFTKRLLLTTVAVSILGSILLVVLTGK